jgi:hypothetical protein
MGYNTVLMVLNDTVDYGAKDPEIGKRIHEAVLSWPGRERDRARIDIYARPADGGCASYGSVVSQEHADYQQIVVVGGNTGCPLSEAADLDWYALDQLKNALERYGYRVTKRRKPVSR